MRPWANKMGHGSKQLIWQEFLNFWILGDVEPKIGGKTPQNGWFIMENPMNKWMIWGYHYFWKHPDRPVVHLIVMGLHIIASFSSGRGVRLFQNRSDQTSDVCVCMPDFFLMWKMLVVFFLVFGICLEFVNESVMICSRTPFLTWDAYLPTSPRPDEVRPNDCDVCEVWDPWNDENLCRLDTVPKTNSQRPWK